MSHVFSYTALSSPYPGYISIYRDKKGDVVVSVRAGATEQGGQGAYASFTVPAEEWWGALGLPTLDWRTLPAAYWIDSEPAPVAGFGCRARHSASPEPRDCNWPICGCDPYAEKVIDALAESGAIHGLGWSEDASAIEAGTDETRSGSAEGESAIPKGDAQ